MAGVTIYLPKELMILYEKLEDGQASAIFQKALKEHFSTPQTVDEVNRQLEILEQETQKNNNKATMLQKKRLELEQKEIDFKKQKVAIEATIKQREHYLNVTCREILRSEYIDIPEAQIDRIIKHLSYTPVFEKYNSDIYQYMKESALTKKWKRKESP